MTKYIMADAVRAAYEAGEEDEALEPLVRVDSDGNPVGRIQDGDYVIFYDIRGEREIELTSSFVMPEFTHFEREDMTVHFATMIQYADFLPVQVAFPPLGEIKNTLGDVISQHGKRQARITESEKAIHISFFLNGKRDEPLPGEDRITVPSPEVENYAETPGMNADAVAEKTIEAIKSAQYDFIAVNFVNVDVVGHIEDHDAVIQAVQAVDTNVGKIVRAAQDAGMTPVITADHGTVEQWLYPDGMVDTGHTSNPVPFVIADPKLRDFTIQKGYSLVDVAPTILDLMNLPVPAEITGSSLLSGDAPREARKVLLVIADGWGARDDAFGNMIKEAHTPVMDDLQANWPGTRLLASGPAVGMPEGTVGNSESGHTHIGVGRRILADRVRIDESIADGSIVDNPAFRWAMEGAKRDGTRLHLLGIVSFYSSHGSVEHLYALIDMADRLGVRDVYHHAMLGRRGERLGSGAHYIENCEKTFEEHGFGTVASVIGRFWSLDREENWDRIEKTYRWLVDGKGSPVAPVK